MQNKPELHHIQKEIILNLAAQSPKRFTQLQPPRLANNTFSYHLKKLLQTGYIESTPQGYILTRKSLKLSILSSEPRDRSDAPRTITMLCVTNTLGEVLLVSRGASPFRGWYGLPSGKIHAGERLDEAAVRELREKTTITAIKPLEPIGVLDFQYREKGTNDLFVHALAFVYAYRLEDEGASLKDKISPYGQLSWSMLGRTHILPEVRAAMDMMKADSYTNQSIIFDEPT